MGPVIIKICINRLNPSLGLNPSLDHPPSFISTSPRPSSTAARLLNEVHPDGRRGALDLHHPPLHQHRLRARQERRGHIVRRRRELNAASGLKVNPGVGRHDKVWKCVEIPSCHTWMHPRGHDDSVRLAIFMVLPTRQKRRRILPNMPDIMGPEWMPAREGRNRVDTCKGGAQQSGCLQG